MTNQQAVERFERLLAPEADSLKDLFFFKDQNKFYVFDRYVVEPVKTGGYQVSKFSSDPEEFSSLRAATSWCIADRLGQLNLCIEIKRLDIQKAFLTNDLAVRNELIKRMRDADKQELISTKITTKKAQLKAISERLDKCVSLAKYWQIRGFNNETARTGRTGSNRKYF
jgi:hypothetical protein